MHYIIMKKLIGELVLIRNSYSVFYYLFVSFFLHHRLLLSVKKNEKIIKITRTTEFNRRFFLKSNNFNLL